MTQEFVPYELAVKLKELGFDEPCIAIYSNANPKTGLYTLKKYRLKLIKQASQKDKGVKAPLFQQAFRWFREKYDLFTHIEKGENPKNFYPIIDNVSHKYNPKLWFDTYEEAELACLEELIEIVETKSE